MLKFWIHHFSPQNKYFFQKLNEKNEVGRYKARLIAQGFSQKSSY